MEPSKGASPYVNTPPSRAASTVPWLATGGKVICSTYARSPGSLPLGVVKVLPSARQPTLGTQLTELRKLRKVTFGLGCTDHDDPFQYSIKLCGCGPEPPLLNEPVEPTAQHSAVPRQEIPASIPGASEPGTNADVSLHTLPSQCSMRIPAAFPEVSVVAPEAQQSLSPTHRRPLR